MFNIGVSLLNRLSTLYALKSLPDEAALQAYMRNTYKGIFFLILGAVLLGVSISLALYLAYNQLLDNGYSRIDTLAITIATELALVFLCFILANKYLSSKLCKRSQAKNQLDEKLYQIKDVAGGTITAFIEGLYSKPKEPK